MAIEVKAIELYEEGKFVRLKVQGSLEKEDYELFIPEIEQQIEEYGKINLLLELVDFKGWSASAAWADTKFGLRHFKDIERLAIVGDKAWEKGMAYFSNAFTKAKVRYFTKDQQKEAEAWVKGK